MVRLEAILPRKYTDDIETTAVYVATIKEKSQTKKVMDLLKEKYPMTTSLHHLKRVRNLNGDLHIILTTTNETSTKEVFERDIDICHLLKDIRIGLVTSCPPLTRRQFTEASKHWPVSFHEDKYITKLVEGKMFTERDVMFHERIFRIVDETSRLAIGCNAMTSNAAVIVDPKEQKVLVAAFDCSIHFSPLYHSSMVAIDMVARLQGGGCYGDLTYKMAADDGYLSLDLTSSQQTNDVTPPHSTREVLHDGYLCTGYDVYLSAEPCVMCAMSLLHSRVRRVFYMKGNKSTGGLGGVFTVHCEDSLNHHFEVFQVDMCGTNGS